MLKAETQNWKEEFFDLWENCISCKLKPPKNPVCVNSGTIVGR